MLITVVHETWCWSKHTLLLLHVLLERLILFAVLVHVPLYVVFPIPDEEDVDGLYELGRH
jgi:hypothetical protein